MPRIVTLEKWIDPRTGQVRWLSVGDPPSRDVLAWVRELESQGLSPVRESLLRGSIELLRWARAQLLPDYPAVIRNPWIGHSSRGPGKCPCYRVKGEVVEAFESQAAAAQAVGCTTRALQYWLRGVYRNSEGWAWFDGVPPSPSPN